MLIGQMTVATYESLVSDWIASALDWVIVVSPSNRSQKLNFFNYEIKLKKKTQQTMAHCQLLLASRYYLIKSFVCMCVRACVCRLRSFGNEYFQPHQVISVLHTGGGIKVDLKEVRI